jgi:hypothetical protein
LSVQRVAGSFSWPFRGRWRSRFAVGSFLVLLLPIAFIPLLGYAIAANRSAQADPLPGPPPLSLSARLFVDGFWTAMVLIIVTAPFAIALNPLAGAIHDGHLIPSSDTSLSPAYAYVVATFLLALPWGFVLLLLMPHATSRFAATGRPAELFNIPKTLTAVARDFPSWNVAAAAIVTGWALGIACVGLFCVGILPGVFYAILVSANASATLQAPVNARTHIPAG